MRVVVSLTTIPTRENSVLKTIESIRTGTYTPDAIYVHLPDWYPRFKCGPDPNFKSKLENAGAIVNSCKDYGSLTKFIPIIELEKDSSTIIIVVDDDATYSPHLVDALVHGVNEFKCPVGFSGIYYPENALKITGSVQFLLHRGHGCNVQMLECAFGVAFPRFCLDDYPVPEPLSETSDIELYITDDYILSTFFVLKHLLCYQHIGRNGDDWSSIWKQNSDSQTYSLSRDGNMKKYLRVKLLRTFDQYIKTEYVDNITQKPPGSVFTMFKALCRVDDKKYSAERVNYGNVNCLVLNETEFKGKQVDAEDPRLVNVNGTVYVIFVVRSWLPGQVRGIAISKFDDFKPVILNIEGQPPSFMEKNWAPFVKDNLLYFVYNYDPLIVISYDFNEQGTCKVVHCDAQLPFRTEVTFLRGGSNLLPYKEDYYLGFCHSRLQDGVYWHFTHAVILDTKNWKVVYVSKPILYRPSSNLPRISNVLFSYPERNCIQDPVSFLTDGTVTVNFDDTTSLLYKVHVPEPIFTQYGKGDIQRFVLQCTRELVSLLKINS